VTDQQAKGEETPHAPAVSHSRAAGASSFHGPRLTILCAARSSIYQAFPDLDLYTKSRDAWSANPPGPVIAHPPCRCWARSWALSSLTVADRIKEMMLAFRCLSLVRRNGGILEQPAHSRLWKAANLPRPGLPQSPGQAWSLAVNQGNWNHRHSKPTWLLLCGIAPYQVAWSGFALEQPSVSVLAHLTPGQRSATPKAFALWLIQLACQAQPAPRWSSHD
jgi:hypothetical protein